MKFYFAFFWILCRADLANLVNEAALLAGRSNKIVVEKSDFIHAVERSIAVELALHLLPCVQIQKKSYALLIFNRSWSAKN